MSSTNDQLTAPSHIDTSSKTATQTVAPANTLDAPHPTAAVTAAESEVTIREYQAVDHATAVALFSTGMLFYADSYPHLLPLWQDYVQKSIADDLAHIDEVYKQPGGNFWVATIADEVVGMVALEKKENGEGELRRMSVKAEARRYGVGRLLVTHLESWASANGYAKVWLSTGAVMTHACKFYPSIGYTHTKTEVVSEDPRFEALYFTKAL